MRRIAIFFAITTLCHGFAVEAPQNTFAVVGQAVSLKCRAANVTGVEKWSFKRNYEENTSVIIHTNYGRNQPTTNCTRCNVAIDQNDFSVLSFNATTLEDGGSYICVILNYTKEAYFSAELIVLDKNSQCKLNTSDKTIGGAIMEDNYLEILCSFSFAGNMVPVVKWFRKSKRISLTRHQADNSANGIHWVHFNTTLQLNASDNGMVFGYEVDFEGSNTTKSTQTRVIQATNALSNVFRWNFTAVVWYLPRNIQIGSKKMIYNFGDRVECSADGNPSPNITWSCDVGMTMEGSVLTLKNDTFEADVNYRCQCTAMSSIFSTNVSETVIIRIAHETERTSNMMLFIIVGVLAAVLTIIFALLIVLYFKGFLCCAANNDPDVVQHDDRSKSPAAAAADRSNKSTEIPVYGEVRKPLAGPSGLKTEKRRPEATANGTRYDADQDDAVIYLDLKGGKGNMGKSPPVVLPTMSQTAMFNQSEYASIDHALQPPPLKKINN